ncbi:PREDICTED: tripartite motif-containing protein 66 [Buceros rhinoceros silvestris]|uniref:tripartite motif-containing protein 66 n=1 Tax=Buceros rhinoceros silvestris TaxID=175836 RepID=UPI0005288B23|nr:PREDICTED: tripartite motif-containing protein 66 [Buceros rhinoceros silvestris]
METLNLLRNCLVCKWDLRRRDPRLLPCLHSFCKDCLPDLIQGYRCVPTEYEVLYEGILSCPVCKQTCFARDIVENFFLKDFPTGNSTMAKSCSMCKEKRPAHSLCTSCNRWLCSSCTEEHRHGKETGDCFLTASLKGCTATEGEASEFSLSCPVHPHEPLKLFCETCDTLTCHSCLLTEHKEHRFRHLDEALQNQRVILENVITKVEEKRSDIQVSAKQLEDRLLEVKHLYKKVENQIKMAKMILMNEISKRTNILLEQLEKITSERKQKLEQQLQGVVVLSRQVEHVQNFISWAVCSKNSIPFLFSKELIVFQIQRLLETNCNTDVGPPLKIRFAWDPSYWTKQLSNLGGFTMEGGHISHPEVLRHGDAQGLQTSLIHECHSPASPQGPVNSEPHQFLPAGQCPAPVWCSHCLGIPHPNKAQASCQDRNCHQHFREPPELPQQHFPLQCSVQQRDKEQRGAPQPMKLTQSGLAQQSWSETENVSGRVGKQLPRQQLQQTAHPGYAVVPHEAQQVHTSHPQPFHTQASLQTSTVQVQLGHLQKIKTNHSQQPPQRQLPAASPVSGQNENTHKQVIQQSLDIMHHQFELEEMKKDLELLLQAQGQSSLQLNQAKPPQHVQQTIVGQINYIVRQPAPAQQQDEAQVCESSTELDAQKPVIPLDKSDSPSLSLSLDEEAGVSSHSPESALQPSPFHPVTKCSTSLNTVGFSKGLEMELPSTKLSSLADPQVQGAAAVTVGPSLNALCDCDTPPEAVPSYSLALGRAPSDQSHGAATGPTPGNALQGSTKCKLENEDFNTIDHPLENSLATAGQDVVNELTLSMQKVLEEPINLSIKKSQHCTSELLSTTSSLPMNTRTRQLGRKADSNNSEKEHLEMDMKRNQNVRGGPKEQKIPYVRLERLKICTSEAGELPVFKLQPRDSEQEGNFLLIIKCGTQSSSMSVKINKDNPPEGLKLKENSEDTEFPVSQAAGQTHSPPVDSLSVDQKCSNGISTTKKSPIAEEVSPIENEDFCAVCLNGGELLCCDHCPKVFHLSCHVPALLSFPVGEWVCTLCRNPVKPEVEYDCENTRYSYSHSYNAERGLDDYDQKKCEKLVLSLLCSSMSLPFHEPVSPLARHYYQIIKRPMDLSVIRKKLQKKDKSHYSAPEELVTDVRLMFWNCAKFNYPDSEVAEAGRCLDVFFEGKLKEIYPDRHFPSMQQEDSDSEVESQNSKMLPQDFQWPSHGQECIQPKRRRRHAESEKNWKNDVSAS